MVLGLFGAGLPPGTGLTALCCSAKSLIFSVLIIPKRNLPSRSLPFSHLAIHSPPVSEELPTWAFYTGIMSTPLLPLPRFLKGLPVTPVLLSDELKAALAMEPSPGGVQYIIATQVKPNAWQAPLYLLGVPRLPPSTVSQAGSRSQHQPKVAMCCSLDSESSDTGLLISSQWSFRDNLHIEESGGV